jgi:hypothetical protein
MSRIEGKIALNDTVTFDSYENGDHCYQARGLHHGCIWVAPEMAANEKDACRSAAVAVEAGVPEAALFAERFSSKGSPYDNWWAVMART